MPTVLSSLRDIILQDRVIRLAELRSSHFHFRKIVFDEYKFRCLIFSESPWLIGDLKKCHK